MKRGALLLLILFSIIVISKAQDTEFWMSPISAVSLASSNYKGNGGFMISNPSNRDATVKIYYFADNTEETLTVNALGYELKVYEQSTLRDKSLEIIANSRTGLATSAGVRITSDVPIFVYYIFDYQAVQETIVLKGNGGLGRSFSVGHSEPSRHPLLLSGAVTHYPYISILASEDNTTVNFEIPSNVRNYIAGSHTVTLNKGQALILRTITETGQALKGSHITSDKRISVIAGEELYGTAETGDMCVDQLVQDAYARQTYVFTLSAGYSKMSNTSYREKVCNYLDIIALEDDTEVFINWGEGKQSLGVIDRGETLQTDTFRVSRQIACATVTSTKPIHCQQITGREASVCHLPNFYATKTNYISFFSYMEDDYSGYAPINPALMLVYKESAENDLRIKYPGQDFVPLFDWISTKSVYVDSKGYVPEFPDWKYIRLTLPAEARNQIVTVQNTSSVFQLGFTSAFAAGTNLSYFSAYDKSFQFSPDTIYKCPGSTHTLIGGIAEYYTWKHPDGTIERGATLNSITVSKPGIYTLVMEQGTEDITVEITVIDIIFDATISPTITSARSGEAVTYSVNHSSPLIQSPPASLQIEYNWDFGEGAVPATSTDVSPTILWTTKGIKTVSLSISAKSALLENMGCDTLIIEKAYVDLGIIPAQQDVCAGKVAQMTCDFTLSGGPNTYQWQSSKNNRTWADIPGATSISYTPADQQRGRVYYRVVVDDGVETATSITASVIVRSCKLPVNHNISTMGYYD
ncbi:MAG: hypothetical protein LBV43_10265 [Prevotella sp.]|jgi:hypothetical protein|nr:hypothetical protein [Prevotella sp.]